MAAMPPSDSVDGIQPGDTVVAQSDVLAYGILRAQQYEVKRIYFQGVVDGSVQRVDVDRMEAPPPAECAGFSKFLVLFNPKYHAESGPVVVRPDEVQLTTVRNEIADSAWLALPGLFWVWVAYTFYEYGETSGRM